MTEALLLEFLFFSINLNLSLSSTTLGSKLQQVERRTIGSYKYKDKRLKEGVLLGRLFLHRKEILTTDLIRVHEGLVDLWVQVDSEVVVLSHSAIASSNLGINPVLKLLATHSPSNID